MGDILKPYYKHNGIEIYCGDCLEILPLLIKKIENGIIMSDPPYPNFHIEKYNYHNGLIDVFDLLKNRQFIFWTTAIKFPLSYTARHLWNKLCGTYSRYEYIYERNGNNLEREFKYQKIKNKIDAQMNRDELTGHPSQKPIRLMKELINKFSNQNDLIIDPFMGVGTTLIAAKEFGRKAIGIEIEQKYCDITVKRLSQEVLDL